MRSLWIFCVLFVLGFSSLGWAGGNGSKLRSYSEKPQPKVGTKNSEIVKWVDLSNQYVLGYGRDIKTGKLKPFAVYDKEFTTPFFPHFWKLLILGSIGISDFNLANLSKHLRGESIAPPNLLKKDWQHSDLIVLEPHFFENPALYWHEGRNPAHHSRTPSHVSFRDLDWDQMAEKSPRLKESLQSLAETAQILQENEEVPLSVSEEGVKNLDFERQADGTYHLVRPNIDHPEQRLRPVKVIDFAKKESSFRKAAAWASVTNILKGGLNAAPLYPIPQAAGAWIERVLDYIELLYLTRHSQALELVLEALERNPHSPFTSDELSQEQLKDGLHYLLGTNTHLSAVFKNAFSKKERRVPSYLKKIGKKRDQSITDLEKNGLEVFPFPQSYFALGLERDSESQEIKQLGIFALGLSKQFRSHQPFPAVDFLNPNQEIHKRHVLKGLLLASNFIYVPIPGLPTLLKMLYKELVIREIDRRQMWESGLLAHLHHAPEELQDSLVENVGISVEKAEDQVKNAIRSLENRRMNPLELNSSELREHQRKVENWIRDRDESYQSEFEPLDFEAGSIGDQSSRVNLTNTCLPAA